MRRHVDAVIFGAFGVGLLLITFTAGDGDWKTFLGGVGLLGYAGYIALTKATYWVSYEIYGIIGAAVLILGVVAFA